jgi:hypothetical protein
MLVDDQPMESEGKLSSSIPSEEATEEVIEETTEKITDNINMADNMDVVSTSDDTETGLSTSDVETGSFAGDTEQNILSEEPDPIEELAEGSQSDLAMIQPLMLVTSGDISINILGYNPTVGWLVGTTYDALITVNFGDAIST